MQSYLWWRGRKKRVRKKYKLFLGRYYSPKEQREWYNNWIERTRYDRQIYHVAMPYKIQKVR